MKKLPIILMAIIVAAFASGCGTNSSDSNSSEETTAAQKEVTKIEKSIDAVAKELGLTGGEETFYSMIGATAGKEYNDGSVELYEFDVNSSEYKDIEKGEGTIEAAACNDGIVLLFPENPDEDIVKKFEKIEFK